MPKQRTINGHGGERLADDLLHGIEAIAAEIGEAGAGPTIW